MKLKEALSLVSTMTTTDRNHVKRMKSENPYKKNPYGNMGPLNVDRELAQLVWDAIPFADMKKRYKNANEKFVGIPELVAYAERYTVLVDAIDKFDSSNDEFFIDRKIRQAGQLIEEKYGSHYSIMRERDALLNESDGKITREEYLELANVAHPDKGGNDVAMKVLASLYDKSTAKKIQKCEQDLMAIEEARLEVQKEIEESYNNDDARQHVIDTLLSLKVV